MDSQYRQEVARFNKRDGIIALCLFLVYIITSVAYAATVNIVPAGLLRTLYMIGFCVLHIVLVCIVILRKKQGVASIGLHKEKIWPAVRLGLLFVFILIVFKIVLPGFFIGFRDIHAGLFYSFIITLFFAIHEDIVFVGFIQTRLYGLFKTDVLAIFIGALFFALMHLPPWIVTGRLDVLNLPLLCLSMFNWMGMYIIFISVYKKYYSLVPVMIIHFVTTFPGNFLL